MYRDAENKMQEMVKSIIYESNIVQDKRTEEKNAKVAVQLTALKTQMQEFQDM